MNAPDREQVIRYWRDLAHPAFIKTRFNFMLVDNDLSPEDFE